jgi:hypothetical protein
MSQGLGNLGIPTGFPVVSRERGFASLLYPLRNKSRPLSRKTLSKNPKFLWSRNYGRWLLPMLPNLQQFPKWPLPPHQAPLWSPQAPHRSFLCLWHPLPLSHRPIQMHPSSHVNATLMFAPFPCVTANRLESGILPVTTSMHIAVWSRLRKPCCWGDGPRVPNQAAL